MTTKEFWQEYVGEQSPEDFMLAFRSHDTRGCVAAYLAERPHFFGIVRRLTWRETFSAEVQHTREMVSGSLVTYLEETRSDWESAVEAVIQRAQDRAVTPEAPTTQAEAPREEPSASEEETPAPVAETPEPTEERVADQAT